MNSNDYNFCQSHKARKEFVCVNSICIDKQKKLSCYKCLEAQHISQHNPREDFKSIYTIIEQIDQEKEERLIILKNAKQQSLDQKKEMREALEKSNIFSPQEKSEMLSKIDEQYEKCSLKIDYMQSCLEDIDPISPYSLPILIIFSKQNTKEFSEEIENIKFKPFESALRQSDSTLIESLKKIQDQFNALEYRINQLETQKPVQKGRNYFSHPVIIGLIAIIIISLLFNAYQKITNKMNFELDSLKSQLNDSNLKLKEMESQTKKIFDSYIFRKWMI